MKIITSNYKVVPVPVPTFLVVNCFNRSFEDERILVPNEKFRVPMMSVPVPPVVEDVVKTVNSDPDLVHIYRQYPVHYIYGYNRSWSLYIDSLIIRVTIDILLNTFQNEQ